MELVRIGKFDEYKFVLKFFKNEKYKLENVNFEDSENFDNVYENYVKFMSEFIFSDMGGLSEEELKKVLSLPTVDASYEEKRNVLRQLVQEFECIFPPEIRVSYDNETENIYNKLSDEYKKIFKVYDATGKVKKYLNGLDGLTLVYIYAIDDYLKAYTPDYIILTTNGEGEVVELSAFPKRGRGIIPYVKIYAVSRHHHILRVILATYIRNAYEQSIQNIPYLESMLLLGLEAIKIVFNTELKKPLNVLLRNGINIFNIRELFMYHLNNRDLLENAEKYLKILRKDINDTNTDIIIRKNVTVPTYDVVIDIWNLPIESFDLLKNLIYTICTAIPYDYGRESIYRFKDVVDIYGIK